VEKRLGLGDAILKQEKGVDDLSTSIHSIFHDTVILYFFLCFLLVWSSRQSLPFCV